jgi:hypothetical protein
MSKKLVRLTEGDLHKIIKESVNRILQEGHGLDTFMNLAKEKVGDYEDGDFRKGLRDMFKGDDVKNFIETGDGDRKQYRYYNPKDPLAGSDVYHKGYKEIGRSKLDQFSRAAGLYGGLGVMAAKRAANKIKNGISNLKNRK